MKINYEYNISNDFEFYNKKTGKKLNFEEISSKNDEEEEYNIFDNFQEDFLEQIK
jgi:hypothetical protein